MYLLCFSSAMNAQTKEFYGTLLQCIWEVDGCLTALITGSNDLIQSDRKLLNQVNIVKLLTHFTAMVLSLELGLWGIS
jgi:hypothetical protein